MLAMTLALAIATAQAPQIVGDTEYPPHSLVRLKAEGVDPKAAILWRVYPSKDVHRATTPRDVFEFAARPGNYRVELLVISGSPEGGLRVDEDLVEVKIGPAPPDDPKPDLPQHGKLDPPNALGRIRFGNAGCTATVIGPRRPDGRWDVLTAAHCISGIGARGTMVMKDGRNIAVRAVTHDRTPDVCWLVTEQSVEDMPYALLAEDNPGVGVKVWHAGYGVDKPGNREDGEVSASENGQGQIRFTLSVSSGDSGGGILRVDDNRVVSTVCCTSGMARKVSMWGGSTAVIRRTRPPATTDTGEEWEPITIPFKPDANPMTADPWQPLPIPIRHDFRITNGG